MYSTGLFIALPIIAMVPEINHMSLVRYSTFKKYKFNRQLDGNY